MDAKSYMTKATLLNAMVMDADDFTALRYLKHREQTPRLRQLEDSGAKMPNASGVLGDLYYSLWAMEPELKQETPKSSVYWRQILDSALQTSAYQEMHARTQLEELNSLVGTISMGEEILSMVPEEDKEQLRELAEAEREARDAEQQIQGAQAQADAAGQLLAELQQVMQGQPSNAQAQQAQGQVQSQMQQAQAQAQAAQMTLEQAQARAKALQQELMGAPGSPEAQAKQTQMARAAQAAATKAAEEVKEVSNMLQSWGIEPKELTEQGIPDALDIVKRMRQSDAFKRFKDLLGRIRHIAARKAKSNIRREGRFVPKTEYGRDIARAEADELAALVHPALRLKKLQQWTRGELRLARRVFKATLGKGPIVFLEDASGSMDGTKQQWAKAIALALAYFAKIEQRTFAWVMFDGTVRKVKVFPNGRMTAREMLEIAESRAGGGTNFDKPLDKAMELIKKEGLKKADILMGTDGECAVPAAWLKSFLAEKKMMEITVVTVLMDVGDSSIATVGQFSDRVEKVSRFTAEEAGQKVFAHM